MKLTPHEEKILALVKQHPEIVDDHQARERIARENGISEKTLRNRIGDLKKYGVLQNQFNDEQIENRHNLYLILKHKKFIIFNFFLITILSVVISFIIPKWYASSATIVASGSSSTNFLSMLSGLPITDLGMANISSDLTTYIAILESRTIREKVVNKFDLINRYEDKDIEYAMMSLSDNTELKVTEEGTLVITVYDVVPQVAKEMADYYVLLLDSTNQRLSREKGKFNREFLENRLRQNEEDLSIAEEELRSFQDTYGIVDIPNQVLSEIQLYSNLKAQLVEAEVLQKTTLSSLSSNDPKRIVNNKLIIEIKKRLNEIVDEGDENNIFPAFSQVPELSLQYARRFRAVEIQNKIMEFIFPQFEQAKLEENKNVPSIQIIDMPQVPINKSKPQRKLIVLLSAFASIVLSIMYILIVDKYKSFKL